MMVTPEVTSVPGAFFVKLKASGEEPEYVELRVVAAELKMIESGAEVVPGPRTDVLVGFSGRKVVKVEVMFDWSVGVRRFVGSMKAGGEEVAALSGEEWGDVEDGGAGK
jgi:hypothetical protein